MFDNRTTLEKLRSLLLSSDSERVQEIHTKAEIADLDKNISLHPNKEDFIFEKIDKNSKNAKILSYCVLLLEDVDNISEQNLSKLTDLAKSIKDLDFKRSVLKFFATRVNLGKEQYMFYIIDLMKNKIGRNLLNIEKFEKIAKQNNFSPSIKLQLTSMKKEVIKSKSLEELKNRFMRADGDFKQVLDQRPHQIWKR